MLEHWIFPQLETDLDDDIAFLENKTPPHSAALMFRNF